MLRLTETEYQALLGKKQNPGKIPHTIIHADGYTFPSQAEYRRYGELKLLSAQHHIRNLRIHPKFTFVMTDQKTGSAQKIGTYSADSSYEEMQRDGTWAFVVEEVKSAYTKDHAWYKRQKKMMKAHHNITIREVVYA